MALRLSRLDGTDGFRVDREDDYAVGFSATGAGDVNGDGFEDIVFVSPGFFVGEQYEYYDGETYLVFGSTQDFGAVLDLTTLDGSDGSRFLGGSSVAGAGDVNGDGFDDLVIEVPYGEPSLDLGLSYVVFGDPAGFGADFDFTTVDGTNGFRVAGGNGSGVGDVNGDGIDDVLVGNHVLFGASAGFPSTIDPSSLDGTTGFRLEGDVARAAGAGDVNGDGIDDLLVGSPTGSPNGRTLAGISYVVFGTTAGFAESLDLSALDGVDGFRLDGIDAYDRSGASVAGAGDVNGDGLGDMIVGAPGASESYVVFGSDEGFGASSDLADLDGTNGFRLVGVEGGGIGFWSSAEDVNGDGLDDLIVGAYQATYVVFGSSSGFAATLDLAALEGADGVRLEGAGFAGGAADVNGDGVGDVVVTNEVRGYVVFGSDQLGGAEDPVTAADDTLSVGSFDVVDLAADHGAGADRDPDFDNLTITAIDGIPIAAGDSVTLTSGLRVTSLGGSEVRFDAPGAVVGRTLSDSFIYEISDGRGSSDTAAVSITYRQDAVSLDALDGGNGFRLVGAESYDSSGWSVAGAGDVNGDGFDDVIVGAPAIYSDVFGSSSRPGQSYVVFGTAAGFRASLDLADLDGTNGFRLDGVNAGDWSGRSVSGAGDVNGDGIDDLIIGAPSAGLAGDEAGESYVVFGSLFGFGPSVDLSTLDGVSGFRIEGTGLYATSGSSVSGAGDVNGDGLDDLIIGAPNLFNFGAPSAAYVLFGSAAGFEANLHLDSLDGTNGLRIDHSADFFDYGPYDGYSVAAAGDVNGDGIDDVIVGDPGASRGSSNYNNGSTYVVYGSKTGFGPSLDLAALDGTNGFVLVGSPSDQSGFAVDGAGDVNGDGVDDLVVGSPGADASFVVFGSSSGFAASLDLADLDGTNGFRIDGGGFLAGLSVAGAGDFNGDGLDDMIVGAPDGVGHTPGTSYMVFGSQDGFAPRLDLRELDGTDGFRIVAANPDGSNGWSVAGAGDVDGDGLDDIIIGAPWTHREGQYWSGESYVVFGFRTDKSSVSTTTAAVAAGSDDAEQCAGSSTIHLHSPELEIGQGAKKLVGLRFTGLDVPEGATITEAYVEFEAAASAAHASRITIALQDSASAATFGPGAGRISARPYLEETACWSPEPWVEGETYRTADLKEMLSALIGTEGLEVDDALAFRFTGKGAREAAAFEGEGAASRLVVEFETDPPDAPEATPLADLDGAAQYRLGALLGDDSFLL